jgi:hypothetical protein
LPESGPRIRARCAYAASRRRTQAWAHRPGQSMTPPRAPASTAALALQVRGHGGRSEDRGAPPSAGPGTCVPGPRRAGRPVSVDGCFPQLADPSLTPPAAVPGHVAGVEHLTATVSGTRSRPSPATTVSSCPTSVATATPRSRPPATTSARWPPTSAPSGRTSGSNASRRAGMTAMRAWRESRQGPWERRRPARGHGQAQGGRRLRLSEGHDGRPDVLADGQDVAMGAHSDRGTRAGRVCGAPRRYRGRTHLRERRLRAAGRRGVCSLPPPRPRGRLPDPTSAVPRRPTPSSVCVCTVSPLGHSIAPVFPQVRSPGCLAFRATEGLVIPA